MIQGEPANRCSPCRLTGTDPGPAALVNEEEPAGAGLPGTYRDEEAKEGRPLAFSVDRLLGSPDLGRGLKARTWTRGTSPETVPVVRRTSPSNNAKDQEIFSRPESSQTDWRSGSSYSMDFEKTAGSNHRSATTCSSSSSSGKMVRDGITVQLMNFEMWRKFNERGTEMIITKAGRRMFPTIKLKVSGLEPHLHYLMCLAIEPFDSKRYRYMFSSSKWVCAGSGEGLVGTNKFLHSDSPGLGRTFMSQNVVSFERLKLTNNACSKARGQIRLHSMHKYCPVIHIQPLTFEESCLDHSTLESILDPILARGTSTVFKFPEVTFYTVTAYQNQDVTQLKIATNPFAKGFRENSRSRDPFGDSFVQHPKDVEFAAMDPEVVRALMSSNAMASSNLVGGGSSVPVHPTGLPRQVGGTPWENIFKVGEGCHYHLSQNLPYLGGLRFGSNYDRPPLSGRDASAVISHPAPPWNRTSDHDQQQQLYYKIWANIQQAHLHAQVLGMRPLAMPPMTSSPACLSPSRAAASASADEAVSSYNGPYR